MASYINITLDTIGPGGVSVKINGDEESTTSTSAELTITCSDTDLTDYQMKIWGTATALTEDDAEWETFQESKNITLSSKDGIKTVYVKVRDDVWNESVTASDTITLFSKLPTVESFRLYVGKISLVQGKNATGGNFYFDEDIDAVKIMIVQDINAKHDDASNISIPTTNGSYIMNNAEDMLAGNCMEFYDKFCAGDEGILFCEIFAGDIVAVSPGDGVKLLKVFVRSAASGNWSV